MAPKKSPSINFEQALAELNAIVDTMEQGELPLEKSLEHFEKGVALIRQCQKALSEAEQKVAILTKENQLKPYQSDE